MLYCWKEGAGWAVAPGYDKSGLTLLVAGFDFLLSMKYSSACPSRFRFSRSSWKMLLRLQSSELPFFDDVRRSS